MLTALTRKVEGRLIPRRQKVMQRLTTAPWSSRPRSVWSAVCVLLIACAVTSTARAAGRGPRSATTDTAPAAIDVVLQGLIDDPFNLVLSHAPEHVTRCVPFVMTLEGEGNKWRLLINVLSTAQMSDGLYDRVASSTFVRLTHAESGADMTLQLMAVIPEIDEGNTEEATAIVKAIILDIFPCEAPTGLYTGQAFRLRPVTDQELPIANEDEVNVGVSLPGRDYTVRPNAFQLYMNNRDSRTIATTTSVRAVVDEQLGAGVSVTLQNLTAGYGGGPRGDVLSVSSVAVVDALGNVVSVDGLPQEAAFTWDVRVGLEP